MSKILLLLILTVFVLPGCLQSEKVDQTLKITPAPTPTPTPVPGIAPTPRALPLSVTTDKSSYFPGEQIEIKLTLKNDGAERVRISPFPPEVRIVHSIADKTIKTFPPGEEVELGLERAFPALSDGIKETRTATKSHRVAMTLSWVSST